MAIDSRGDRCVDVRGAGPAPGAASGAPTDENLRSEIRVASPARARRLLCNRTAIDLAPLRDKLYGGVWIVFGGG